ncbi:regulator of G-protein signaling loco [Tetranychus urticae]|uniref:RGS domain-containing protein n=1 Tax=Tetranychus urticae TaxID=32264 RepID=T1KUT2_TETUR|nr:regulator of G-protein signaling loco [Tetranychus urticae]
MTMSVHPLDSVKSEPIYCNLIDNDDFGLDTRLERLRVSASVNKNQVANEDLIQNQLPLPNGQQQTTQKYQQSTPHHPHQQHQLTQQQPQPQHQNSTIHPYLQYLLSASSTPTPHLNHLQSIEDIDCYINSPAEDFDIGDSTLNSRQLDATLSSDNSRFQSYKYLTQTWPEGSTSKMLDSPLGRKVYHVAAEQTKTLSPPKDKCVKNYGRVKSWGNSFDNLLNDAIGVKIYSRFLSREFSDENILFWLACEKYKKMIKKTEARKEAKAIYDQFLTINGSHTVNVDADARNSVAKNLKKPTKELFDSPQTQVYNLMKNDSYKRFLTSELYEMCLESEKTGKPLPVCSKDDCDKKKVPSSSKRRLSLGSWVLKKTFRK